ncbi:integrase core domain-containing protein [Streptomyces sparsogenes]|uniref:integrase core domain-containing protein n=1 Tax=Streptomyces sparsogenes TaxID=67365 RepID=UPI0033CDFDC9
MEAGAGDTEGLPRRGRHHGVRGTAPRRRKTACPAHRPAAAHRFRQAGAGDAVFQAIGTHVLPTLPRVPRMPAIAERWIGSCRREATDRILITGERHLRLVISEYAKRYNQHRPHQSLGQRPPDRLTEPGPPTTTDHTRIHRHDRLGGLIHEYTQVA